MKIYCLELIIAFIFYLVVRWLSNVLYWQNGMFQFDWEKRYNYHPFDINPSSDRKKQAGNLMLLSLAPAIAMICTAACFQLLNISEDLIFSVLLIPIFFFLFRFVVIFMDGSRIYFGSVKNLVLSFLAPIAFNFIIYWIAIRTLIKFHVAIYVPLEEIRNVLWVGVLVYILKMILDLFNKQTIVLENRGACNVEKIVHSRQRKLEEKYQCAVREALQNYELCDSDKANLYYLTFAIMIYEDYNRPFTIRILEYFCKLFLKHKEMSLGIMQYKSDTIISSSKSIKLAIKKIYESFRDYSNIEKTQRLQNVVCSYNPDSDYQKQVMNIYRFMDRNKEKNLFSNC